MISPKKLGILLVGIGAGYALAKYMSMSPEEKEKLTGDIKDKAKGYFDDIKNKGTEAVKEHFGDVGKKVSDMFGKTENPAPNT